MALASKGNVLNSFNNVAAATTAVATTIEIPSRATVITWQHLFSTNPASVTVNLLGSLDGTNFVTLDSSTVTTGAVRTITSAAPIVKAQIGAISGTTNVTVMVIAK